jgi:hypothetical protein
MFGPPSYHRLGRAAKQLDIVRLLIQSPSLILSTSLFILSTPHVILNEVLHAARGTTEA